MPKIISASEHQPYNTSPIDNFISRLIVIAHEYESVEGTQPLLDNLEFIISEQRRILLKMYKELKQKRSNEYFSDYPSFRIPSVKINQMVQSFPLFPVHSRSYSPPSTSVVVTSRLKSDHPLLSSSSSHSVNNNNTENDDNCNNNEENQTDVENNNDNNGENNQIKENKVLIKHDIANYLSARSISTYPFDKERGVREGDPICDQYKVILSKHRVIIAMSDGCNWGFAPRDAAIKSSSAFVNYIQKNIEKETTGMKKGVQTIRQLAKLCLRGVSVAHNQIIKGKTVDEMVGTTTMLGGVLVKVDPSLSLSSLKQFCKSFCCSSFSDPVLPLPPSVLSSPREFDQNNSINNYSNGLNISVNNINNSNNVNGINVGKTKSNFSSLNSHSMIYRSRKGGEEEEVEELDDFVKMKGSEVPPIVRNRSMNLKCTQNLNNLLTFDLRNLNKELQNKQEKTKKEEEREGNWILIFANIGDCKAFAYRAKTNKIEEITKDTRKESPSDVCDCGGRLGPYINDGPDLRNLKLFLTPFSVGDYLFVCSDGVHDNFDPEIQGKSPKDLGLPFRDWKDDSLDLKKLNEIKSEYQVKFMESLISSTSANPFPSFTTYSDKTKSPLTSPRPLTRSVDHSSSSSSSNLNQMRGGFDDFISPRRRRSTVVNNNNNNNNNENESVKSDDQLPISAQLIADKMIGYCEYLTARSRSFLENNPDKVIPNDYRFFPGKMDHTSIFALLIDDYSDPLLSSVDLSQDGCKLLVSPSSSPLNPNNNVNNNNHIINIKRNNNNFNNNEEKGDKSDLKDNNEDDNDEFSLKLNLEGITFSDNNSAFKLSPRNCNNDIGKGGEKREYRSKLSPRRIVKSAKEMVDLPLRLSEHSSPKLFNANKRKSLL